MSTIEFDIQLLEKRLNLPNKFYNNLLSEDDWSFIIKLSSLFEAACTHILTVRLNSPEIENALSFLEQANSKCGKIVLLKELDVIVDEQKKFLIELATLRNMLVHKIENTKFNFDFYINKFDSNQKKGFVKWAGHGINESIIIDKTNITRFELVTKNPKLSIWITASEVLACLYLEVPKAQAAKSVKKILIKSLEKR